VLAAKNKHEEAVAEYDIAIKLDPSVPERFNDRGYSLLRTGQYDRAIADLTEALRRKPGFSMALENRGWAYWLKGDLDKALADFDEAVRLNPDDLNVLTDRSAILDDKGDFDRALADLDKVLAKQPDNGRALNGRAWAAAQKGDLDKALADSERAVAILPGEANVLHTRAWIYMNKGVLDLALADLDKAIGIDPELAGAYADRGRAYELKGDRDKAIADYRKSLALKSRQTYDDKAKAKALQHLTTLAAVTPGSPPSVAESGGHDQGKQAEPAAPEKRIALVIGNANYVNVKALKNSDSDARAIATSLRQLGFEVIEKHDLTLPQLTQELKAFGDKASEYDWAMVYYAGHGIEVDGVNYLIPVDAELTTSTHVDDEAMPLDRVLAKVEGAKKLRLVILDACRENPFAAKMASAGTTRSIGRGLARNRA
jgi:tetratricopeptide (TPR) repeat protein